MLSNGVPPDWDLCRAGAAEGPDSLNWRQQIPISIATKLLPGMIRLGRYVTLAQSNERTQKMIIYYHGSGFHTTSTSELAESEIANLTEFLPLVHFLQRYCRELYRARLDCCLQRLLWIVDAEHRQELHIVQLDSACCRCKSSC